MRSITQELQSFSGVAAGQTAVLTVPSGGPTYPVWFLEAKHDPGAAPASLMTAANFATYVENIKIKIDGEILVDISGAELNMRNGYYGYPQVDGLFPIRFSCPEFLDPLEELRFALGTQDVGSVTIQVKFASGVTAPELRMFAQVLVGPGADRPRGQLVRITGTPRPAVAAGGLVSIHDLPVTEPNSNDPNRGLKALHVSSALITEYDIKFGNNSILEGTKELLNLEADHAAYQTVSRTPQSGYTHFDFTGNRYNGILPMAGVKDFRLEFTYSGAESAHRIVHEEVVGAADL